MFNMHNQNTTVLYNNWHESGKLVSKLLEGSVPHRKPWVAILNVMQNQDKWHVEHKQCLFALDERANAAVLSRAKYFFNILFFLSMNLP